jgi:hypothetical protein
MVENQACPLALPFAMAADPATGNVYFWEIMLPGAMVGVIVGYSTQKYGRRSPQQRASG